MKNFIFGGPLKSQIQKDLPKGAGGHDFKKSSHRTMVPTHIENFSILAQLESV